MANSEIKQHISIAERAKWNKVIEDHKIHLGSGGVENHSLGDGTTPGFSTNDFTNQYKQKLIDVQEGALNNPHPETHPWTMITGLTKLANTGKWEDILNLPQQIVDVVNNTYNAATVGGIRITINSASPANPLNDREIWIDSKNLVINIYKNNAWVRLGAVYR